MNICVPFMIDFPYNDEINEFTIKFNPLTDRYTDLIKFLETYDNRRINIELINNAQPDFEVLKSLTKINRKIHFKLNGEHYSQRKNFEETNLKYFFNFPAHNWDTLNSFINLGGNLSDIYITDELGFSVKDIHQKLSPLKIKLRVVVNLAQMTDLFSTNNRIKAFFIRPEDLEFYSQYVDTFEFYFGEDKSKINTFYKVYLKDKEWFGNLDEIIADLDIRVDSRTLIPEFASYRVNCGKRCFKNSECQLCERVIRLSEALQKKDIIIKREEEK